MTTEKQTPAIKLIAFAGICLALAGCDKMSGDPTKALEKKLSALNAHFTSRSSDGKDVSYSASATLDDVRKTDSTVAPFVAKINTIISHDSRVYIQQRTMSYKKAKWESVRVEDLAVPSSDDYANSDEYFKDNNDTMSALNTWLDRGINC